MQTSKPKELTGVLAYDPELRFTPGGYPVSNFILINPATGERADCEMWRDLAEDFIEEYFGPRRGATMTVTGYWKAREYRDRNEELRQVKSFVVTRYRYEEGANANSGGSGNV